MLNNYGKRYAKYVNEPWLWNWGRSFRIRREKVHAAPPAEDGPWRHIRLAIKPRYLGNHASQIKSYYGTLSGSQERFFRIRHEKVRAAPPGGEITMTSYPARHKTSLSQKPCIADKKVTTNHYQEVMFALSESVMKSHVKKVTIQHFHEVVVA